jgi:hypothetical protein
VLRVLDLLSVGHGVLRERRVLPGRKHLLRQCLLPDRLHMLRGRMLPSGNGLQEWAVLQAVNPCWLRRRRPFAMYLAQCRTKTDSTGQPPESNGIVQFDAYRSIMSFPEDGLSVWSCRLRFASP